MCCVLRLALITLRVPLFCHGGSFVGFGRVPGGMADLVYDAGGCCRLRSVAIGFVLLWGRDIGYASCVVSV